LVSEKLQGENLSSFINKGELNMKNVKTIFKSFLEQVDELQRLKIIHNDIKCENVIIHNNEIKIIDFEFASVIFDIERTTKTTNGTPVYIAPEKFNKSIPPSLKTDIWSLGVVFVEMIMVSLRGVSEKAVEVGIFYETLFNTPKNIEELKRCVFAINNEYIMKRLSVDDPILLNFCFGMLDKDPKERSSTLVLLNHEWLNDV